MIGATLQAGDKELCQVGAYGTATAGDWGTATAGNEGTATAGKKGEIQIRYWDEKTERYRTVIGYIGEDGLEPGVAYKLDDNHRFVKAGG